MAHLGGGGRENFAWGVIPRISRFRIFLFVRSHPWLLSTTFSTSRPHAVVVYTWAQNVDMRGSLSLQCIGFDVLHRILWEKHETIFRRYLVFYNMNEISQNACTDRKDEFSTQHA